ncbi:MAG: shikimate dehydrogenase [Phycisphaerae bacterium]
MRKTDRPSRIICPLTSSTVEQMLIDRQSAVDAGADTIEFRLDLLENRPSEQQLEQLIEQCPVESIVTCRSLEQGGRFRFNEFERLELLHRAAVYQPDYIDIEQDVDPEDWPEAKIILSYHDFEGVPNNLESLVAKLEMSRADVNKIAYTATGPQDAFRALDVIRACQKPTISLAMGEYGAISRLLAGKVGAFGTFAALSQGAESAPGQPTIEQLRNVYRFSRVRPDTTLFGVVGSPIAHSMSPAIHNAAFAESGINGLYVPIHVPPGEKAFITFMTALITRNWLQWRGLSITLPHKEHALKLVEAVNCDKLALDIGAVNTLTFEPDGRISGDNTDYEAAIRCLCAAMNIDADGLKGRRIAILGAGGVARALVAALTQREAEVTIYNRSVGKASRLAAEFRCKFSDLELAGTDRNEIVINCTPVGMAPDTAATPLNYKPPGLKVVFDTIYNPIETQLLKNAKASGCLTVSGVEMFVNQGVAQFERWTGRPAPRRTMRNVVLDRLKMQE